MTKPGLEPWMSPGVRDIRGLNKARPTLSDRGVYAGDPRVKEYVKLAERFIDDHRERIRQEALAMNVAVNGRDLDFAKQAIHNVRVVPFSEARQIDRTATRQDKAFYLSGRIYLQKEYVDRWLQNKDGTRVWEELVHEAKHAIIDSSLAGSRLSEADEHAISQWIYPYYVNE